MNLAAEGRLVTRDDVEREIRSHIALRAEELERAGWAAEEARVVVSALRLEHLFRPARALVQRSTVRDRTLCSNIESRC